jgi:hypothetical protein
MKIHIITLILVPFVLACNNHNNSAKSTKKPSYYAKRKIPVPSSVQTTAAEEFTCINKPSGLDYNVTSEPNYEETEEDKRIQALINRGNYQSNFSPSTGTNFQGAIGVGTGSSYSSSYFGANAKKKEIEACTNDGALIEVVKPQKPNNSDKVPADEFSENSFEETKIIEDNTLFADSIPTNSSNKTYGFDSEEIEESIENKEPADTSDVW